MRIYYVIGLVLVAAALGIILSTFSNASSYVTFAQAEQTTRSVHVIGTLVKDAQGVVTGIEYQDHHRSFSFLLQDNQGAIRRVFYAYPMPMDFVRADKVVIVGQAQTERFLASKILLKCPSKYEKGLDGNNKTEDPLSLNL